MIVSARKPVVERGGRKPASESAWAIAVAAQPASVNAWTRLSDLRIGTQLAQLAHRSNHGPLGGASADPLDTHLHALAVPLDIYHDPFNEPFE